MKKKLTQELIIKHWTLSEDDTNEIKSVKVEFRIYLKNRIRIHRGLSKQLKKKLVDYFLVNNGKKH